ncbi:MAG: hypothetical protein WC644_07340 [Ignavibacteria bacterium]
MKRWNGSSIVDITMPIDSSFRIVRMESLSDNEIWMSTASNTIYQFE